MGKYGVGKDIEDDTVELGDLTCDSSSINVCWGSRTDATLWAIRGRCGKGEAFENGISDVLVVADSVSLVVEMLLFLALARRPPAIEEEGRGCDGRDGSGEAPRLPAFSSAEDTEGGRELAGDGGQAAE